MAIDATFWEETNDPHHANDHNFFKVERWSKDAQHVTRMVHAGNRLDRSRAVFADAVKRRPRRRYKIRQREQWPA